MNVNLYEKIWMWAAAVIIVVFIGTILVSAFGFAIRPPSHVETIDPTRVMQDARFSSPGVAAQPDGSVRVTLTLFAFGFLPGEIRVPAGRPVTFRLTSMDVTHGFVIPGTNVNTMVVPGYVSQLTYTFRQPGEYLAVCNEYCGLGHHTMQVRVIVEAPGAPAPAADSARGDSVAGVGR